MLVARLTTKAPVTLLKGTRNASIFPPNIGSVKQMGKFESDYPTSHPYLFDQMKSFYREVVKGPAPPAPPPRGFFQWYHNKYMARGNESATPLLHYVLLIIPIGYVIKAHFGGHIHANAEFH
ncbi:hypothetical protein DFJ74DRAFT_667306 [Hyaloraphidium curvatum]|nr:hypothetical protein DFJ74DRAFT_667306 [Hyaloraphidium curvatum]